MALVFKSMAKTRAKEPNAPVALSFHNFKPSFGSVRSTDPVGQVRQAVEMKPSGNQRHKGAGPDGQEKWRHKGLEQQDH